EWDSQPFADVLGIFPGREPGPLMVSGVLNVTQRAGESGQRGVSAPRGRAGELGQRGVSAPRGRAGESGQRGGSAPRGPAGEMLSVEGMETVGPITVAVKGRAGPEPATMTIEHNVTRRADEWHIATLSLSTERPKGRADQVTIKGNVRWGVRPQLQL